MNKRLPLLFTLLALILLVVSIAYWFLQLYKPEQRPLAPPPAVAQAEPSPEAAAYLFGGQPTAVAISNYQLTGVVAAGANSAVILVAEGSPPKAVRIGREIVPGVTVVEVHARYVMLSEGGVMKRVDLAPDTGASSVPGGMAAPPVGAQPVAVAPPQGIEPQTSPGVVAAPPTMQSVPPPGGAPEGTPTTPENAIPAGYVPEPNTDGRMPPQPGQQQGQTPPPPNQVQMPPPIRGVGSPVNSPSQVQ